MVQQQMTDQERRNRIDNLTRSLNRIRARRDRAIERMNNNIRADMHGAAGMEAAKSSKFMAHMIHKTEQITALQNNA